jgi:hypothetical protein
MKPQKVPLATDAAPSMLVPFSFLVVIKHAALLRSDESARVYALPGASLDLVAILRHFLLFLVAGPAQFRKRREGCVPSVQS